MDIDIKPYKTECTFKDVKIGDVFKNTKCMSYGDYYLKVSPTQAFALTLSPSGDNLLRYTPDLERLLMFLDSEVCTQVDSKLIIGH